MEQRRQFTFIAVSIAFFYIWLQVAPLLFPGLFPQPGKKPPAQPEAAAVEAPPAEEAPPAPQVPPPQEFAKNQTVLLGEAGFDGGYLVQAQCNSVGGSLDWVQLTDPRYTSLDRTGPFKVLGNAVEPPNVAGVDRVPNTLETSLKQIDAQLAEHKLSLASVDWEVRNQAADSVTFRYPAPDGTLEILKTYTVHKVGIETRDDQPEGYFVDCDLTIRNLSDKPVETSYKLQGPVGVELENADDTRVFRAVKVGTLENLKYPDDVTAIELQALELTKQVDKAIANPANAAQEIDNWREAVRYAGVDNQFFAALVVPKEPVADRNGDGTPDAVFDVVEPMLLYKAAKPERSNLSVVMNSRTISVPAGKEVTDSFQVYCGPKRSELLRPIAAEAVLQYGWFASISRAMLWILNFFHSTIGLHYALSIMMLTVVVRLCMMPITKRLLVQSEKMKELAPKMKELQDKYKDRPEEFARATSELYRKHGVHPAAGCLPMFIQLPIFYGLYNSLHYAVDLRLAQFLWIDDLAAPDALFQLGFKVPWFEWTEFNLLPVLAVALIVVQQKFLMPPPTSDEQAMQYRIINVMMVVMGVLFYRTQSGLMIYIITTTIWGLVERLILKHFAPPPAAKESGGGGSGGSDGPSGSGGPAKPELIIPKKDGPKSWLEKLMEAADEAKNATASQSSARGPSKKKTRR